MKTITLTDEEVKLLCTSLTMAQSECYHTPEAVFSDEEMEKMPDPDNPQCAPIWKELREKLGDVKEK